MNHNESSASEERITKDEFDARCWRATKKVVALITRPGLMSQEATAMALRFQGMLTEVEVAVSEGREL